MEYPFFSVITPTLNQGKYLEQCIRSVMAQNYPAFEHIVVDGGSTDETLDILKRFSHIKWISGKDSGQSDALNKALRMAKGDVIAWLNSDDYYLPDAFKSVQAALNLRPDAVVVVGNTLLHHQNTSLITMSNNRPLDFEDLIRYWDDWIPPTQPSVFFRAEAAREILEAGPNGETGPLDTSLHYAMDYDLWLRIAKKHRFYFIPKTLVVYRMHGASKSGYEEWTPFYPEYNVVYRRHKGHSKLLPNGPLVTVAAPFSKDILARSAWHANAVNMTVENFQRQKIRDIEILIITDVETPERHLQDLSASAVPVRFIKIPRLDELTFFEAVRHNAAGMALHCPSLESPLHFQRLAACLTKLITEPETQVVIDSETPTAAHPYLSPGSPLGPNLYLRRSTVMPFEAFSFPTCDTPEVSIIVTLRAGRLTASSCLKKLFDTSGNIPVEVICIVEETDSEDGRDTVNPLAPGGAATASVGGAATASVGGATAASVGGAATASIGGAATASVGGVGIIRIQTSDGLGPIRAANEAARSAKGRILAFIDCAVMTAPGWLSALLDVFNIPDAGAVCGMLLYPDGTIKDAGGIVFDTGIIRSYGYLDDPVKSEYNFIREVDFCTRGFMAVRREVFILAGGFQETVEPRYAAADLSLSMRKAGFKTVYTPAARVFHFGPDAFLEKPHPPGAETLNHCLPANNVFTNKWAGQLREARHPRAMELIRRAHSGSVKTEALIAIGGPIPSNNNSEADTSGDNTVVVAPNAVRFLARAFLECGARVTIYLDADSAPPDLGRDACDIEITRARGRFTDFLIQRRRRFDVIWLSGRDISFNKADSALELGLLDSLVVYDAIDLKYLQEILVGSPDDTGHKTGRDTGHETQRDTGLLYQIYSDEELYIRKCVDMVVVPDVAKFSLPANETEVNAGKPVPSGRDFPAYWRKIVLETLERAKKKLKSPTVARALPMELKKRIFENRKNALVRACGRGRPVYIWGTGGGGATTLTAMQALGVEVEGFIDPDSDKLFHESGKAVLPPSMIARLGEISESDGQTDFKGLAEPKRPYIAIGSLYGPIIRARLRSMGYEDVTDTYTNIFL
jgi:GT2 family glycosyltransferase